jgi:hypothetical protein
MNCETVVADLFKRIPRFQSAYDEQFAYMGNEKPGAYIVFGSVLVPALEKALAAGDLGSILPICAFLEDVAEAAQKDNGLESLIRVGVGEWLEGAANETLLAPWLGAETKRICRYIPGLATQRRALRTERNERGFRSRISSWMNKLRAK